MSRAQGEPAPHAAPCAETAEPAVGVDSPALATPETDRLTATTETAQTAKVEKEGQEPVASAGQVSPGDSARSKKPPDPVADPTDKTLLSQSPPFPSPVSPRLSSLAASLIGQRLDHYELIEFVGGGGMGLVFRAQDTSLHRTVAVKILAIDGAIDTPLDEETVRRFRNEAQSAARLDHDNIARVYYVGEARGLNYIVFEYIEGTNLRDLVARAGPLPTEQVLGYSLQIAAALAHAAERGVVHRDIKPSNVLIAAPGEGPSARAKLVDMGLSRLQIPDSNEDLTASNITLGTFDYISPEQARDPRNADVRSDLYSLGCTMYFMLSGRPPFPDGNAMQKLLKHQGDAPQELTKLNPRVPGELWRIVRKTLAKDPSARYQEPRGLMADLSLLADDLGVELPHVNLALVVPASTRLAHFARRHGPWLAPLAAMLLAIFVLDRIWSQGANSPNDSRSTSNLQPNVVVQPGPSSDKTTTSPAKSKADDTKSPRVKEASSLPKPPPSLEKLDGGGKPAPVKPEPLPPPAVETAEENPHRDLLRRLAGGPSGSDDGRRAAAGGIKVVGPSTAIEARIDSGSAHVRSSDSPAARLGPGDAVAASTAVAAPPPSVASVLYVDPSADGTQANEFSTLKAAMEKVRSGGTIELRYSGRRVEQPFRLTGMANPVTVRAAEDCQPVVVFQPTATDAATYARQMIALSGVAQLNFLNVAIELYSPPAVTSGEAWSLFSLHRSQVDLKRCTLTIVNASTDGRPMHDQAAFFQMPQETGAAAMMMSMDMSPPEMPPVGIRLWDTVARGEAVFVQAGNSAYPLDVSCTNALLALSQPFFASEGGRAGTRAGRFLIKFDHVTAHLRGGLCQISSSLGGPAPETSITCNNSILLSSAATPLISQEGDETVANLQSKLTWSGDKNLYDSISMFWRVTDLNASRLPADQEMMQLAWDAHWKDRETPVARDATQPLGWQSPPDENRVLHLREPDDYRLRPSSPATGGASDQKDVGARLSELPPPPPRTILAAPKLANEE
jgi:serine/threonine-protein kinase